MVKTKMIIAFENPFPIGEPAKDVIWEYGVMTSSPEAFPSVWNDGKPSFPMSNIVGVKGATDSAMLESFLYAKLEQCIQSTIGYSMRRSGSLQVVTYASEQTIGMSIAFDNSRQYAIGFLKFRIV